MSRYVTALTVLLLGLAPAVAAEPRKPNIVVILADDLGYADLGCQGCKDIPTPHIDTLAKNGVRCTSGYANHPFCAPTRAALMTGQYSQRFGFEYNSGPERSADPKYGLPKTVPTLAEKLKANGYATGMVGKWHLGFKEGLRPHERGFDFYFGFLGGTRNYLSSRKEIEPLVRNGKPVIDEKEYLTDAFAREALEFIDRSKDRPFFLYVAFNAVHVPLQATSDYEKRFPDIKDANRKTYAGMLSAMDDAVGKMLAKLRDLKLEENTLIVFYSDNGGPTQRTTSRNDPLRGFKAQMYEGGIRVPFLWQWKGTLPAGKVYDPAVMGFDVHATALAAAGVEVPKDKPLDGVNLLPYLTSKQTGEPHDKLFWQVGPKHAARVGDWKLVSIGGTSQLFNLKDDIGEKTDLAAKEPAKLKELEGIYAAWDKQMMPPLWVQEDAKNPGPKKEEPRKEDPKKEEPKADDTIATRFKQLDTNGDGKQPPRTSFIETAHTLTVDGRERTFFVQAPKNPSGPLPVVFFFHGGGGRGENMAARGFREMVARDNFLAVYPTGWKNNWNDGRNAARIASQQEGVDDVKFVRAIVEDLAKRHQIDRGRIYASGASNGGIFSHYLAAHAADLFAAVAPIIGGLAEPVAPKFKPSEPISLLVIQGDADPLVPIKGGAIANQDRGGRIIPTEEMLQLYVKHNGITGKPVEETPPDKDQNDGCRTVIRRYPSGTGGVKMEYWLVQGGGHTMPGRPAAAAASKEALVGKTSRDFDGLEVIWKFFQSCPARKQNRSEK